MNPLTRGEYPKSMRTLVGKRLPKFSKEESRELKGSFDFLGLNYYSSYYTADAPHLRNAAQPAIQTDSLINATCKYINQFPNKLKRNVTLHTLNFFLMTVEHKGKPLGPMVCISSFHWKITYISMLFICKFCIQKDCF
jgi:beta-glucosidase/6-phospho-beta-glucosidase/beta-galactosidase